MFGNNQIKNFPLDLQTSYYHLIFSANGSMHSFVGADGKEKLNKNNPGKAFYLVLNSLDVIKLSELEFDGNILKCSSANKTQSVYFEVKAREKYCFFKLVKLEGVPTSNVLTLHFEINTVGTVKAMDADYMTVVTKKSGEVNAGLEYAGKNGLIEHSDMQGDVQVSFKYIWNRNKGNPLGSFALYAPLNDDEEDDTIIRIWTTEKLPHPNIGEEWTYERALKWVSDWQKMAENRNQFMLEAKSLDELYEGVEIAQKAGCNEVYLFTNSWRNNAFWPNDELNWSLKKDIYPNGEADLRKYSDYLSERGMRLNIHYVSGGFGFGDPQYVVKPDDRLASYGEFDLVEDVSETDTIIKVKPHTGVELPFTCQVLNQNHRMPTLHRFNCFSHLRIGDEIIKVGQFINTDTEIWTLKNCRRGVNKNILSHKPGETVKGFVDAYGVNLLPDNDSTLLEEVAKEYAGLLNRCKIAHVEFDGAEIHNYNGNWGYQKFATLIYQNLDHMVTSHDSGGVQARCFMEYRLNKSQKILEGTCRYSHGNYSIPFTLNSTIRSATNWLDAHYSLSVGYKGGAMGLCKPEPMFGVRPEILNQYGSMDKLYEILNNWREVAKGLSEEQKNIIENSFIKLPSIYERSKHKASENVFVAKKQDGVLNLVPTSVMRREKGDVIWQYCQEYGPIGTKQFIYSGDEVRLFNPNEEQVPGFLIRVCQTYDYNLDTKSAFEYEKIAGRAEGFVDYVVAGSSTELKSTNIGIVGNMLLDPEFENFYGSSVTTISKDDETYIFAAENQPNTPLYEAYKLPEFNCRVDMSSHRGIGMIIDGDGSNSVFTIEVQGRDYVVLIDFIGEKYIEIPNGECAWHNDNWGLRMATKYTVYSMITSFKMGFCYLPPHTNTNIKVKNIKLLKEIHKPINGIEIVNSTGSLKIDSELQYGDYVYYDGGDTACIYDCNYNEKKTVKVESSGFVAKNGYDSYKFISDGVWLENQMFTEGEKMIIKK